MIEQERKQLRDKYVVEYRELTGKELFCIERKRKLRDYIFVARKHLISVAGNYLKISEQELKGNGRKRNVVKGRHVITYLLYEMKMTEVEISRMLNYDNRSTINYSIETVRQEMNTYPEYRQFYQEFKSQCLKELEPLMAGTNIGKRKLDVHQEKAIKDSFHTGEIKKKELSEIYNVSERVIYRIINGK